MGCKCRNRWQLWDYVSAKRTNEWLNWWIRMSFEISFELHYARGKGNRLMGGEWEAVRDSERRTKRLLWKVLSIPSQDRFTFPTEGNPNQHGRKLWRLKNLTHCPHEKFGPSSFSSLKIFMDSPVQCSSW